MEHRIANETSRASRLCHGWLVVAAAFLVALFGFELGFYGPGIYLVALRARHGWSIAELSSVIKTYYVLGASFLFFGVGSLFELYGACKVLIVNHAHTGEPSRVTSLPVWPGLAERADRPL